MSSTVILLIASLVLWMVMCAWCGFGLKFMRFLGVLCAGLGLYVVWLVVAMGISPFDPNAVMALMATVLYGACSFGAGYLTGRIVRQFRASRVERGGV
jgi:hypothetical protein